MRKFSSFTLLTRPKFGCIRVHKGMEKKFATAPWFKALG